MGFWAAIAFFLIGLFGGAFWFSATFFTTFYGLPKACYWCARGLFRWIFVSYFIVSPLLWNLCIAAIWYKFPHNAVTSNPPFYWGLAIACACMALQGFGSSENREEFAESGMTLLRPNNDSLRLEFLKKNSPLPEEIARKYVPLENADNQMKSAAT